MFSVGCRKLTDRWRSIWILNCDDVELFFIKVEKMNLEGMRPQSPRGLETLGQELLNGVVNGLE